MAIFIALLVVLDGTFPVGSAGDHRADTLGSEGLSQVVGVVALVGQQMLGAGQVAEETGGGLDVGDVSGRQPKAEGSADRVRKCMDFRGFPAAREADLLRLIPPFPPKAERWALM